MGPQPEDWHTTPLLSTPREPTFYERDHNSFLFRIFSNIFFPQAGFDPPPADDTSYEGDALLTKPPLLDFTVSHFSLRNLQNCDAHK